MPINELATTACEQRVHLRRRIDDRAAGVAHARGVEDAVQHALESFSLRLRPEAAPHRGVALPLGVQAAVVVAALRLVPLRDDEPHGAGLQHRRGGRGRQGASRPVALERHVHQGVAGQEDGQKHPPGHVQTQQHERRGGDVGHPRRRQVPHAACGYPHRLHKVQLPRVGGVRLGPDEDACHQRAPDVDAVAPRLPPALEHVQSEDGPPSQDEDA
mmetsp:Transcript_58168/g.177250  ORF Transcript_58168/g.177250 Transcript_58168/m.177250 type:complete len:215 (+) Transcript_58168:1126-1770(+)